MTTEKHNLVPKHELLTAEQKNEILKELNVSTKDLPKIHSTDASIVEFNAKPGDIIKITRESPSAKEAIYYRAVI